MVNVGRYTIRWVLEIQNYRIIKSMSIYSKYIKPWSNLRLTPQKYTSLIQLLVTITSWGARPTNSKRTEGSDDVHNAWCSALQTLPDPLAVPPLWGSPHTKCGRQQKSGAQNAGRKESGDHQFIWRISHFFIAFHRYQVVVWDLFHQHVPGCFSIWFLWCWAFLMSKAFANAWYIRTNDIPRPKRHGACVSFRDSFPFRVPTSSVQTGWKTSSQSKYTPRRTRENSLHSGLIGMLQVLDHLVKHRPEPRRFKAKNNDISGLDKVGHPLDLWKPLIKIPSWSGKTHTQKGGVFVLFLSGVKLKRHRNTICNKSHQHPSQHSTQTYHTPPKNRKKTPNLLNFSQKIAVVVSFSLRYILGECCNFFPKKKKCCFRPQKKIPQGQLCPGIPTSTRVPQDTWNNCAFRRPNEGSPRAPLAF